MAYRYQDLDDQRFQKLCQSLLVIVFPNVQCLPVRQSDGGRDAVVRQPGKPSERVIYQVKWTADHRAHPDPVKWLEDTIAGEHKNIQRLVKEGAQQYVLMTNMPSTAHPKGGRLDRLDRTLDTLSKSYGIPMSCWWRDELDRRMDLAPDALKLSYPDVLTGFDAFRAWLENSRENQRARELDRVLKAVLATQWANDRYIRFKQAGLENADIGNLFVDVPLSLQEKIDQQSRPLVDVIGAMNGAALYYLSKPPSRSVVLGAPGQGKSTLGQFVCQAYRAALLQDDAYFANVGEKFRPENSRLAFRVELREYAQWVEGLDPFSDHDPQSRRPRGAPRTVEGFLAHVMSLSGDGSSVSVADVRDILDRYPTLLIFDGLDEVANSITRELIVKQIDEVSARLKQLNAQPSILVTARPSYDALAEPSRSEYAYLELQPLNEALRISYLRKWATHRQIDGKDRRDLTRIFRERSAEPHVLSLATNPMQLTILLYLINRRSESVPKDRTGLYREYMSSFLDREAEKDNVVRQHRLLLEEVTGYLGWYLQASAESNTAQIRLTQKDLAKTLLLYLHEEGKDVTLVEELFTAMRDRVWVITSRVQGTYEFDVQPIREFFAAQHLVNTAPLRTSSGGADKIDRFKAIASRPYWLNTTRFMAGFFVQGELFALKDALDQLREENPQDFWPLRVARTLVQDGVFDAKPRARSLAVTANNDALGLRLLTRDLTASDTQPYPPDRGGQEVVDLLRKAIERDPAHFVSLEYAWSLVRHDQPVEFSQWWLQGYENSSSDLRWAWLRLGSVIQIGSYLTTSDLKSVQITNEDDAAYLLAASIEPADGSAVEAAMIRSVLSGRSTSVRVEGVSLPADLFRVANPDRLIAKLPQPTADVPYSYAEDAAEANKAAARLRKRDDKYERLLTALRGGKSQGGTTTIWGNSALELTKLYGQNWLAREIAIIGASATGLNIGGDIDTGRPAFGPDSHPGTLLRDIRFGRGNIDWWTVQHTQLIDIIDHASWALAAITSATPTVLTALAPRIEESIGDLPAPWQTTIAEASLRIADRQAARKISYTWVDQIASKHPATAILLAHHVPLNERALGVKLLTTPPEGTLAEDPSTRAPILSAYWSLPNPDIDLSRLHLFRSSRYPIRVAPSDRGLLQNLRDDVHANPTLYPWEIIAAGSRNIDSQRPDKAVLQLAQDDGWFTNPEL
ncbi:NACHT domain-containing protein [Rathayibacter soli]|uniref:NACHT domain-containing protein n=1 Tax=Rathayibacter soli TaxID=3144168 RepID=UPI0027E4A6DA|nr:NACHT domain-containing protein [Glaciibacter superstes]